MADYNNKEECLYQNLTDAMCAEKLRDRCMALAADGENEKLIHELKVQREQLLEAIHTNQKALDSLDYLIFQTEKNRKQEAK